MVADHLAEPIISASSELLHRSEQGHYNVFLDGLMSK